MKKNFIYNFLLTGSNLLFPLLTFPYLSRILGANGLGICNFIISYGQNYIIIAALGIPVYGIREIAKVGDDKSLRSKLFFEILSIHFFTTCLLLVIYFVSIFLYADLRQYKELALLGGSLILFNVFSLEWLFTGVNDFKYITIRSVIIRALSVIAIFLLVKKSNDFIIYFIIMIITVFATVLMDVYYSRKFINSQIALTLKGVFAHLKAVAVLGLYMVLTSIYAVLPSTLLGFLSTKSAVGYYYGANKIIRMVISVFSALITVMIPKLNLTVEQKQHDEYVLLINKALNAVISFGIPITFFVFLLADHIVMLLAGEEFINSVFVIKVMAPIILMVAFAQIFVLLILSVNRKDKQMILLSAVGMTISLIINLAFIPNFAERATGFSQLISEFFVTLLAFSFSKKILTFDFPVRKLILNLLYVIPFVVVTYLCNLTFDSNFLIIILSGLLCGIYFILYQYFILKDNLILEIVDRYLVYANQKNRPLTQN
jgi:O-antigen/teichoic acid export membrane protein